MEFVERLLGTKRKRQERLLSELGIDKEIREAFFVPKEEKVAKVRVDNKTFLKLLETGRFNEVLREQTGGSDTHTSFHLFIEAGEDVVVETSTWRPEWGPYYGDMPKPILGDINKMGFKYDAHGLDERVDPDWWRGWGLYKREE